MDIPRNPIITNGIELPYKVGSKITEAEASFLNKTVLRYVKKHSPEGGPTLEISNLEPETVFPIVQTRARRIDPEFQFVLNLVSEKIEATLVEKKTVLTRKEITELARAAIAQDSYLLERGKEIYAERGELINLTSVDLEVS